MSEVERDIFSDDELEAARRALHDAFGTWIKPDEAFGIVGRFDGERLRVTIELADTTRSSVARFEAGYLFENDDENVVEVRALLVEFLGGMLDTWLRDDRWPPPHLDWQEYSWERTTIAFRGSVENEALTRMADELLASADLDEP